jgi:hypothetical protein
MDVHDLICQTDTEKPKRTENRNDEGVYSEHKSPCLQSDRGTAM